MNKAVPEGDMYTEAAKKAKRPAGLGTKLAVLIILFAVALMALLWLLQTVFLESYYKYAVEKKTSDMLESLSSTYSSSEILLITDMCCRFADITGTNDVYFYMEGLESSFRISSSQDCSPGRIFFAAEEEVLAAKLELMADYKEKGSLEISYYMQGGGRPGSTLVRACIVESAYREPAFLCLFAPLTPIDSTVGILAEQLLFVTMLSLVAGGFVAFIMGKRIARPLVNMKNKAELLAGGNYDVDFEGGEYAELSDLADALNYAVKELSKAEGLQRDVLANVSHDLRTPLTLIKSYAEMIRDLSGGNPEKREEHLEVIMEEADRLDSLVSDILSLSKLQSEVDFIKKTELDICRLVSSAVATFRVLEEERGFFFSFSCPGEGVKVFADEKRISQVLYNFLSNAVAASRDEKDISVEVEDTGDRVFVRVKDRGIGIAPEDRENIWLRYRKASEHTERASKGGSGLGLAIAREILQRHDATFGVDSEPGEGSTFWFSLEKIG